MLRYGILLLIACSLAAITANEAEERQYATCAGTLVANADGTRSCVTQVGISSTGYPIYRVTNLNTGVTSFVTQNGFNANGQPTYSVSSTYPMTTYVNTCTGTIVTNSDGTRSCVTTVGTSSLGYPIQTV